MPYRVLVVDDDAAQLDMLRRSLRHDGFDVTVSRSAIGVSALIRDQAPDVVLLDVNIPELRGDRLLGIARKHAPKSTLFVLYSACDESYLRALCKEAQADGWLSKSLDPTERGRRLKALCAKRPAPPP